MKVKEILQERAKKAAELFKKEFIQEQKNKYSKTIDQYESLLVEYHKSEIELKFLEILEEQIFNEERNKKIEKLKQRHILLLKKVKDIENMGILEEYDAVMEAIKSIHD